MRIRTMFIALFAANSFFLKGLTSNNSTLTKVPGFSWENCGKPEDPALLQYLKLYPDPIFSPGYVEAGVLGMTSVQLDSQISVNVTVEREVAGVWVKIPCIDDLGSCHYPNLCELLDQLIPPGQDCPEPLHTYGLPCHCPFKAGDYGFPSTGIYVPNFDLPAGKTNFKVQAVLRSSEKEIGCLKDVFKCCTALNPDVQVEC